MRHNSCGFVTGSDRSMTCSTSEKIPVVAPIPRARVNAAVIVKPGNLRNCRNASLKSANMSPPLLSREKLQHADYRCREITNSCIQNSYGEDEGPRPVRSWPGLFNGGHAWLHKTRVFCGESG